MKSKSFLVIMAGVLLLLFIIPVTASSYAWSRTIGSSGPGAGQFSYPHGIAIDSSDNIYVADSENYRIQKFDSSGSFSTQWGSIGSGNGQFNRPDGICVGGGYVYVVEGGITNNRVQKFTSGGGYLTQWGTGFLLAPKDCAVDAAGNVYVTDGSGISNHSVQKFDSDGNYLGYWGSYGSANGQFLMPQGIAIDSSDNVYVADSYNARIQKFTSSGGYIRQWGSAGSGPGQFSMGGLEGVFVDASGHVFTVDFGNRIQEFDSDGNYITGWGSSGSGNGQFNNPRDGAIDSLGNVYISDQNNDRVQEFGPAYSVTYDGNGATGGTVPTDSNSPYLWGSSVTVLGNTGGLTRTGYSFNNWNTAADGTGFSYGPGDGFAISTWDVTLYAQWTPSSITVTAPNGGETWYKGIVYPITWAWTGDPGPNVEIVLLKGGTEVGVISSSECSTCGSYVWTIPISMPSGTDYTITIRSVSQPAITDTSDADFTIAAVPGAGSIEVNSVPAPAFILLDGVGTSASTNTTLNDVPAGLHTVTIGIDMTYFNATRQVTVTSGATSVVEIVMDPVPPVDPPVQKVLYVAIKEELGGDTTGTEVSAYPHTVEDPTISLWEGSVSFDTPPDSSLVAIDHAPNANWQHPITYYAYTEAPDGTIQKIDQSDQLTPATNYAFQHAAGTAIDPGELWQPDDPYVWKQACVNNCTNNYAILISGGKDKDNNFVRYWNDIAFMYNNLIEYGYAPSHITVMMSDGSNSGVDRCIATSGTTCTQYDSSPRDLTGDGVNETILDARKNTVLNNIDSMKPGGSKALPAGANLIVFSTSHGGLEAGTGYATIYAWSPDGTNPYIRDTELMLKLNALSQLNSITLVMENCFSGGFKDNFIDLNPSPSPTTQKRVIMTAANGDEWSYGNGFSNAWTTAVSGHTRYYGNSCAADSQCASREIDKGADLLPDSIMDERISASEGFAYTLLKDPYAVAGDEHPLISANDAGSDTTTQFISECSAAATPKITVTSPTTGDRWQQDTTHRITWDAPGLAGENVKITLLKSGVAQTPLISSSVSATNPSYIDWRVPAAQITATTYTVKVETLDADTAVSSTSKTFSIIAAPTTNYGKLTITAVNESGTVLAAAVTVDGNAVCTPTTTPCTTSDISPLGDHTVELTLEGYYPFKATANVSAGITTVPYTMRMMPSGENKDEEPYGGIDVSSSPSGARVWFSKTGSVPTDTSMDTPHVIILTEPGDYDVYVTKEGYQQSETRTVAVEIRTPTREPVKVDFTLTPELSSDYTIDGFYAPIDMNGVVNSAKAGQTIPVKWHLSNMNGDIADPASFVTLRSYLIGCTELTGDPVKAVDEYAPGNSGLQYLGNGNWQYNWMTPKSYASTTNGPCRKMYVEFEHGQKSDEAFFKFK